MVTATKNRKVKTLLGRHPVIIVLGLLFFAFSLVILLVFYLGTPAVATDRRSRKQIRTYRIPPGMSLMPETFQPALSVPGPAIIEAASTSMTTTNGVSDRLFNVISLAVAVVVAVLIATLLSHLLIH